MSFQFFKNGREISAPRRIKWRFKGHSQIFESAPDKLDINRNFWRQKLGIAAGTEIQIYEDGFEIKQENATNIPIPTPDPAGIAQYDGTVTEPSVPEASEDTVNTPKRKTRRQAAELSDLPTELDNTDNTPAE
jgi:hypothetical protein